MLLLPGLFKSSSRYVTETTLRSRDLAAACHFQGAFRDTGVPIRLIQTGRDPCFSNYQQRLRHIGPIPKTAERRLGASARPGSLCLQAARLKGLGQRVILCLARSLCWVKLVLEMDTGAFPKPTTLPTPGASAKVGQALASTAQPSEENTTQRPGKSSCLSVWTASLGGGEGHSHCGVSMDPPHGGADSLGLSGPSPLPGWGPWRADRPRSPGFC